MERASNFKTLSVLAVRQRTRQGTVMGAKIVVPLLSFQHGCGARSVGSNGVGAARDLCMRSEEVFVQRDMTTFSALVVLPGTCWLCRERC